MNNRYKLIIIIFSLLLLTGCSNSKKISNDALIFKKEYEAYNDLDNKYRNVTIDVNNPMIDCSMEEIIQKINNKDSFILYVGYASSSWARSVVSYFINSAKKNNIDYVYYVNTRPDGTYESEIRDYYDYIDNKITLVHDGSNAYHEFIKIFSNIPPDYKYNKITSLNKSKYKNQKRVDVPSFMVIKNGKLLYYTTGISDKQTDAYMDLNQDIKNDINSSFDELFNIWKS